MAAGIYRFTFTANANSDISIDYSTNGGASFNPVTGNQKLQLNSGDTLQIALQGPTGWTMPGDLQVIVARANNSNSGQNYSPFVNGFVYLPVTSANGSMNGATWTSPVLGNSIQAGNGGKKYEVTVAFPAQFTSNGPINYFAVDPEMDIQT